MFRSRPVQYLGLLLLVLACLGVIFFPLGPAPTPEEYTITVKAPRSFDELARDAGKKDTKLAGKSASQVASTVIDAAFPSPERTTKGQLEVAPGGTVATIVDSASTRPEAESRTARVLAALSKVFPGVTVDPETQTSFADFPVKPVFALGSTAVYPFTERTAVKLGLDLQGGVNLVLQVRRALFTYTIDKTITQQDQRDAFAAQVRDALSKAPAEAKLNSADVNMTPGNDTQVEIRTQAADENEFNLQAKAIDDALKSVTGYKLTLARKPQFFQPKAEPGQNSADFEAQRLDRTVEIVRSRVDKLGVSEPLIQKQGTSRIIVQLPGIKDPEKAVQVIGTTARMEIRLLPEGMTPVGGDGTDVQFREGNNIVPAAVARERSELIVPGEDVKPTTTAAFGGGGMGSEPAVHFELSGDSVARFARVTAEVAGKHRFIPIFLDERCISAPTVNSAITGGQGEISGGFKTMEEARQLALLLNSGALPAPIDVIENRTVSATLGADSLNKSLYAGLIGLVLVAVYMIGFYRLAGMLANFALVVYMVLNLACFILIGGTLTLPGIAGFLLAIAMSLDTNVLVFERLREEMAIQPTFAAALRAAFSRAWTAILDSHVTTLIAAVVLFNFGTGPIKGFALTLGVGVLLSLFSAISVTRLFMWSVAGIGEKNQKAFGGAVHPSNSAATGATTG